MASTELNQLMWLSAGVQALEIILKDASARREAVGFVPKFALYRKARRNWR